MIVTDAQHHQQLIARMQRVVDAAFAECKGDAREMVSVLVGAIVIASAITAHFDAVLAIAIASLEESRQMNQRAGLPSSHVCNCPPRGEPS